MDLDYGDYFQFLLALIFVIGLIALATALVRRFGLGGALRLGQNVGRRGRRLSVVEIAPIDARRRLVLVRRDDVEHLILLGANSEILIEDGIPAKQPDTVDQATDGRSTRVDFRRIVRAVRGDGE